jgi:hypothetical protein
MNEIMRKRVLRILENLPDETAYQVLDYLEFLESKHGTGAMNASPLQRLAEGVEDTLRATRVPAAALRGTMNVVDAAARLMDGLASAGRAAVEELGKTAPPGPPAASGPPEAPRDEPRAEDPPAA